MPETRWAGLAWALWLLALLGLAATAWLDRLLGWPGRSRPRAGRASNGLNILYVSCGGFALPLTPTGRLPSRRWRWWAWAAAVFVAASALDPVPLYPDHPEIGSPLGVQAMAEPPLDLVIPAAGVVVLVALVVAAGSLVGLFRASVVSAWPCRRWPPGRPSCAAGGGRRRPAGRDLRRHHQDPPLQGRRGRRHHRALRRREPRGVGDPGRPGRRDPGRAGRVGLLYRRRHRPAWAGRDAPGRLG
ncbi:MAG: hypothetical protein ACJ742_15920 [Actinomycetes bacterium]